MGRKKLKLRSKSKSNRAEKQVAGNRKNGGVSKGSKRRKVRSAKHLKAIPAKQGIVENGPPVGYKRPPKEHQFQPGQSGNPAGLKKGESHLRWYVCRYLAMTEGQLRAVERSADSLSQAQRAAIRIVRQIARKGAAGVPWLAIRELWHYDEGRPPATLKLEEAPGISQAECDSIREQWRTMWESLRNDSDG